MVPMDVCYDKPVRKIRIGINRDLNKLQEFTNEVPYYLSDRISKEAKTNVVEAETNVVEAKTNVKGS